MEKIIGQVLGGTNLDQQGEKLTRSFLNDFCQEAKGKKIPLHQHHDMSKETVGYFENLRLIKCINDPNEWTLIADVYVKEGFLDEAIGGFSISGTELLYAPDLPECLLYLPFPEYNQDKLLDYFISLENIQLNKWIKKSVDPVSSALFIASMSIVITPIWDDIYKRKIAPRIESFMDKCWPKLKEKNLGLEHIQVVNYNDNEIQVRFIGEKGKEEICYSSLTIQGALSVAIKTIKAENKDYDPILRVVLLYNTANHSYVTYRIEFSSGEVVHFA